MTGPDVGEEVEVTPCMWCIILVFSGADLGFLISRVEVCSSMLLHARTGGSGGMPPGKLLKVEAKIL